MKEIIFKALVSLRSYVIDSALMKSVVDNDMYTVW